MADNQIKLQFNFKKDFINIIAADLSSMGYEIPSKTNKREIMLMYFNMLKRKVSIQPRLVENSTNLKCPRKLIEAFSRFVEKSKKGEDINPYLRGLLLKLDYNDLMLYDWGIHHFHLDISKESDGFIKRTGALIFAIVTEKIIYAIDIRDHVSWTQKDLIEIIHSNWPELLEPFRLKGAISVSEIPSDKEIGQLRNAGVNSFLQLSDGTIYTSIGGGFTRSGDSIEAVQQANQHIRVLKELEKYVEDNLCSILNNLGIENNDLRQNMEFKLETLKEGFAVISEVSSHRSFKVELFNK